MSDRPGASAVLPERWAWLCAFPPRELRSRDVRPAEAKWVGGLRPDAAALAWVHALGAAQAANCGGDSCFTVVGLALLRPGTLWHGPLTAWSPGAFAQVRFWNRPLDAYSVSLVRAHRLPQLVTIYAHIRDDGEEALIRLRPSCMVCRPAAAGTLRAAVATAVCSDVAAAAAACGGAGGAPGAPRQYIRDSRGEVRRGWSGLQRGRGQARGRGGSLGQAAWPRSSTPCRTPCRTPLRHLPAA